MSDGEYGKTFRPSKSAPHQRVTPLPAKTIGFGEELFSLNSWKPWSILIPGFFFQNGGKQDGCHTKCLVWKFVLPEGAIQGKNYVWGV